MHKLRHKALILSLAFLGVAWTAAGATGSLLAQAVEPIGCYVCNSSYTECVDDLSEGYIGCTVTYTAGGTSCSNGGWIRCGV